MTKKYRSDFTYTINDDTLIITDLNLGNMSVTNDIENVLDYIKEKENAKLPSNLHYFDSYGELNIVEYKNGVIKWIQ